MCKSAQEKEMIENEIDQYLTPAYIPIEYEQDGEYVDYEYIGGN